MDMTAMVNGLIKINNNMIVDFRFIDKINQARSGLDNELLLKAFNIPIITRSNSLKIKDLPPMNCKSIKIHKPNNEMQMIVEQQDENYVSQGAAAINTQNTNLKSKALQINMF